LCPHLLPAYAGTDHASASLARQQTAEIQACSREAWVNEIAQQGAAKQINLKQESKSSLLKITPQIIPEDYLRPSFFYLFFYGINKYIIRMTNLLKRKRAGLFFLQFSETRSVGD